MTLSIIAEGTYKDETEQNKITGWELYEKGETNTLITSDKPYTYEMDIPYGETKTYYARIYIEINPLNIRKEKNNGEKVFQT